jgi:hypothetical protein
MSEIITDSIFNETCCNCGMRFPMYRSFYDHVLENKGDTNGKGTFYCPRGHAQHYLGESHKARAERLAAEISAARQREETLRHGIRQANAKRLAEVTKRKRLQTRIAKGICPCCNRTFLNVQRHMAMKHPEFTKDS